MENSCHCPFQTARASTKGASPWTSRSDDNEGLGPKPCFVARTRQGAGDASQGLSLLLSSQRQPSKSSIASMGMAYCSLVAYSHRFCWPCHGKDVARCSGRSLKVAGSPGDEHYYYQQNHNSTQRVVCSTWHYVFRIQSLPCSQRRETCTLRSISSCIQWSN